MDRQCIITPRDLECMLCDETAQPQALPLSLLRKITNDFSDDQEIGTGGFAVVYKGILENRTVAVKRMFNTHMYEKEFQREVECLIMVKHKNVVRFLGYCADTQGRMEMYNGKYVMADVQQRLLCFEYLPKGCLQEYITDTSHGLSWRNRYQIITGICEGLHYLHQRNIVHLDLKPANILLDDNWVPKITDFGISRCFDEMQSQVMTKISGTNGYLAPESFNHTEVTYRHSYRLDIYSLGVVIIEMLTGKKGYHDVDKVVKSWSKMLEKTQSGVQLKQVRVCAEIGMQCIDSNPANRPDTQLIIDRIDETEMLDEYIEPDVTTSHQINPDMFTGTMHALWLSYQQLNPDIRRCIEYCSIFPKGFKLRKNELFPLWIAQGFVKTIGAIEDMENVAEGYIQELVSYSFLRPEGTSSDTNCFTIPDVLHDILDKVAGNCFRIENAWRERGDRSEGNVPRDVQHLFVQKYDGDLITEKILALENLLTLIVYVVDTDILIEETVIESICKRLHRLRVLAIAFSKKHRAIMQPDKFSIPKSICQLKNLHYFAFRTKGSCTLILPRSLNKLQLVQFLDFGDCNNVDFTFGELIKLRHIFYGFDVRFPNISRLNSLRTIPSFRVRNEQGYELKQLRDLNNLHGSLVISGLENVKSKEEALEANLVAKKWLRDLAMLWSDSETRCNPEDEAKVLEGMCPPAGLQELQLDGYKGSRYPDWMVGKQNGGPKNLQSLCFHHCMQLVPASELAKAFPHLHVLKLWWCNWDALPGNMEHLTSLKELEICRCFNIRSLPTLPLSLEDFILSRCDDKFIKSCQTFRHPNWQKIEHIPRKRFP